MVAMTSSNAAQVQQLPIFLINLTASVRRRAYMRSQLDSLGLRYRLIHETPGRRGALGEIVDAALNGDGGARASNEYVDVDAIRRHAGWLTPGSIDATLSHNNAYKAMIDEDIPYALVLEDDACLSPEVAILARDFEPYAHIARGNLLMLFALTHGRVALARDSRVGSGGLAFYARAAHSNPPGEAS